MNHSYNSPGAQAIPSHTTPKYARTLRKSLKVNCRSCPESCRVFRDGAAFRDGVSLDASGAYVMIPLLHMQHSASCNTVRRWIRFDRPYCLSFTRVCVWGELKWNEKVFRQRWLDHSSIILYCCQIKGRKYTCAAPLFPAVFLLLSRPFSQSTLCQSFQFHSCQCHLIERLVEMPCMIM